MRLPLRHYPDTLMKNWGKKALLVLLMTQIAVSSGCAYFQKKGIIKSGNVQVAAVADAGKPATLNTSDAKESVAIPAGSDVHVTETAEVPATDKTPFQPAKKDWTLHFPTSSAWVKSLANVTANTGSIDTSVALKKVESAESRPLLYAAIGSILAAGFFLYRAYPTPALACGAAAVVFFLSWKASGLPDWFYVLGACGLVGAGALYLGHERGEKAAVVAGTPVTPIAVTPPPTFSPVATINPPKTS